MGVFLSGCAGGALATRTAGEGDPCPPVATAGRCAPEGAGIDAAAPNLAGPPADALAGTANAPEVRSAEALQDAASAEIDRAIAARFPAVTLEGGAGIDGGVGSAYADERVGGAYSYALRLDVPLFEGGRIAAAVDAARSDYAAAGEVARDRRVSTALDLAIALADGARYRETAAILSRQEASLSRLSRDVRDTIAGGAGSQVDLDDIGRQFARVRVLRQEARFALAAAEAVAARYGVPAQMPPPVVAEPARTAGETQLFALALERNARLRERAARIEGAEARIAGAESEFLPTVSVGLGLVGADRSLPGIRTEHAGSAGLRVSMPILDGGLRSSTVRQRRSEKLSAEFERQTALAEIAASVRTAVQRRDAAGAMLSAARTESARANAMLRGTRSERAVGVRSTFDEIRANENLATAEIAIATALWQARTASYVLAAETGLIAGDADQLALK